MALGHSLDRGTFRHTRSRETSRGMGRTSSTVIREPIGALCGRDHRDPLSSPPQGTRQAHSQRRRSR